jgi:hypothetical protein
MPGQKIYLLTITDDFSRKLWITLLYSKGETSKHFFSWKARAELETKEKLVAMRSDNAKEFLLLANQLEKEGVRFEPTVPYHPQLNGISERINRTIIERVRAMMSDTGLPNMFWGETVLTSVYLHNKMPHGPKKRAPDSIYYKESVRIDHLKAFGCVAYVWIPKEKRSKLDLKAWKGIMIGYEGDSIYKIFNPVTKKLEKASSVRFDEMNLGMDEAVRGPRIRDQLKTLNTQNPNESTQHDPKDTQGSTAEGTSGRCPSEIEERGEEILSIPREDRHSKAHYQQSVDPMAHERRQDDLDQRRPGSDEQDQESRESDSRDYQGPSSEDGIRNQNIDTNEMNATSEDAAGPTIAPRRPQRERRVPKRYENALVANESIPQQYRQAVEDPVYGQYWLAAVQKELNALAAFETWEEVELPEGRKAISSKWVFALKKAADGSISKFKARLVARGFTQQFGIDYEETFAPTVKYDSLRAILSLATSENLEVHQLDIENAYLAGTLEEEIFMTPPEGVDTQGRVLRLRKSLYGLKQSARVWNQHLTDYLVSKGFRKLDEDHGVLVLGGGIRDPDGAVIPVYVDDMLIVCKKKETVTRIKRELAEQFKIKDLGEVSNLLNITVKRDRKRRTMTLSQESYANEILERFNMLDAHPVSTPMDPGRLNELQEPGNGGNEGMVERRLYQQAMGCLIYLMVCTRPDIAYAVSQLSRYCQEPLGTHWEMLRHLLRYIRGTSAMAVQYSNSRMLVGYTDSDYAREPVQRKSTGAYLFMINGGPISWNSKRMATVATSTMEAEYMAMAEATKQAVWTKRLLISLGMQQEERGVLIFADNKAALLLSKNPENHPRSKHIQVRYHYVREAVTLRSVEFEYVSTKDMLADGLTKPLPGPPHQEVMTKVGLINLGMIRGRERR